MNSLSAENRSKEEEMMKNSTGHGTVNVPFSQNTDKEYDNNQQQQQQKKEPSHVQDNQAHESTEGFGHTVQHGPSPRTIKRDLNNI
ncbi:MAG: hypothetical protein EXX96DRAFT_651278 [Benjaminiella poitrasii]|nr:MAG: hypothetical protein EXX96DRAFT_651278 [Benjaminiella poitrasii]